MRLIIAAMLVLALALPAQGAAQRRPELHLRSVAPLVVLGTGFGPRERVIVTVVTGTVTRAGVFRATRAGRLTAAFELRLRRCSAFTIRAVGTQRSRAILESTRACRNGKSPPKQALPASQVPAA